MTPAHFAAGVPRPAVRYAFLVWLVVNLVGAYWFAWVALSAALNVRTDAGGNLVFLAPAADHTVYPFTYVAAIVGFALVLLVVFRAEWNHRDRIVVAPLVAYLTGVGMLNLYEQGFLAATVLSTHSTYWWTVDFGTPGAALFSAIGLSWVLASAPWWRRQNRRLAACVAAVWVGSMVAWVALGFPSVETGGLTSYLLNATGRVAAQLVPVALVAPPRMLAAFTARFRSLRPDGGSQRTPGEPAGPTR